METGVEWREMGVLGGRQEHPILQVDLAPPTYEIFLA
jgi:hypothetical protein